MSNGFQQFIGMGNLCADAELKTFGEGNSVLNFRIAINESYLDKNNEKQEKVEFVNCSLWGKRATKLAEYLTKGTKLLVRGSLQTRTYEKDGEKRYATDVRVQDVTFAGGGNGSGKKTDSDQGFLPPADEDSLPF